MCNFETCFLSWQLTVLACVTLFEVIGSYLPCSYYVKGRERERRVVDAEYKLYEQFCNRAERPNCPVPSARRMRSREMARSQFWTAWTSERWGTLKCLWDRYISFTPLIPTYVLSFLGRSICVVVQKYLRFQPATSIFQFKLLWVYYPVAFVMKSVPLKWGS